MANLREPCADLLGVNRFQHNMFECPIQVMIRTFQVNFHRQVRFTNEQVGILSTSIAKVQPKPGAPGSLPRIVALHELDCPRSRDDACPKSTCASESSRQMFFSFRGSDISSVSRDCCRLVWTCRGFVCLSFVLVLVFTEWMPLCISWGPPCPFGGALRAPPRPEEWVFFPNIWKADPKF